MNWRKVAADLREGSIEAQEEQKRTPNEWVASNAALGATAMILGCLANAIEKGIEGDDL